MDNFQNRVNCYTCGVSDEPIVSLKVEYSDQICELLRKSDIFLQNSQINEQISTWDNCDHCLQLISELSLLISKQAEIVEQIKDRIATEAKKKVENVSEAPEIKLEEEEEEEEGYKSETEFEPSEFFCKIEVDPDAEESISQDNEEEDDEDEDTFTIQTFDPPTPNGATTSLEESKSHDDKNQEDSTLNSQIFDPPPPKRLATRLEGSKRTHDEEKDTFVIQTFKPPPPKRAKTTRLEESKRPDKEGKDTFTLLIVDPPLLTLTEKATKSEEAAFTLEVFDPASGPPTIPQPKVKKPRPPRKSPLPPPLPCPTCNKLFRGSNATTQLRLHVDHVHGKPKIIMCPYCTNIIGFVQERSWLDHLLTQHETLTPEKPLSCPICPKTFAISQLHEHHVANHAKFDGKYPLFCQRCDKRFQTQDQLDLHRTKSCPLLETKEAKVFPCSLCNTKFPSRARVAIHQRSKHPELLTWKCATCGSLHLSETHLATHSLLHGNADSYDCLVCTRGFFKSKDDLSLHLTTSHTGEETIPCGVSGCPALFPNVPNKLQHMGSAHNEAVFPCSSCPEKFVTLSARIAHVERAHKDGGAQSFPCEWDACGKVFTTQAALGRHVSHVHKGTSQRTCETCGKQLSSLESYRYHVKTHSGVKDFICEICGRAFMVQNNLTNHMVSHAEERPFKCEECGKAFGKRYILNDHVKKTHRGGRVAKKKL
ncbi:Zinc finger protein 26 [Folsomia candida]|uniref:Zinc finger protein 26 n=1 Tax=Folsomia candida TaxID=158441 RepID=A0A226CX70_FOLCA|nr:Zinc finger protein 26 [Folsomia candida]